MPQERDEARIRRAGTLTTAEEPRENELIEAKKRDRGQTLVEYALILALFSILLVGSLQLYQGGLTGLYQQAIALFP